MQKRPSVVLALGIVLVLALGSCATRPATFESVYADLGSRLNLTEAATYTVVSGDTLTAITKNFYGDDKGYWFPLILAASNETVTDPDLIQPGMVLTIPDFELNVNDPSIKRDVKKTFRTVAAIYVEKDNAFVAGKLNEIADTL